MRRGALFCVLWMALPVGAQTSPKGTVFCCTDNGHQVCGDVLPLQCYGKGYREVSPQGTVRRLVEPPLTPEQLARQIFLPGREGTLQIEMLAGARRNGALAGMVVGALTVLVWQYFQWLAIYEIIPGFICSFIAIILISLMGKAPGRAVTDRFEEADRIYRESK